jgi:hypothetical protein
VVEFIKYPKGLKVGDSTIPSFSIPNDFFFFFNYSFLFRFGGGSKKWLPKPAVIYSSYWPPHERKLFGILITYKRLMKHEVMKPNWPPHE